MEACDDNVDLNVMRFAQPIRFHDGSMLRLRELRITDRDRLRAFFAGCSEEALRYRFMSSIKAPSESLLNYLMDVDGYRHVALVVTRGFGESESIVAEGRFAMFPQDRDSADVAFLVHDDLRRRGIATLLLQRLGEIAMRNGINSFSADVLADNRAMLSFIRKTVKPRSTVVSSGVIHFEIPLINLKRDPLSEAA